MTKTSGTITFFGSGPVAAKSLELLAGSFNIEAVITKPRPAHHKGAVPVLDMAERLRLPVHTVTSKHELDTLMETRPVTSEVAILIDFGIIVSQAVIDYFPLGIINSHFSILPEWRGADPITFAILSGQQQTGVSLMLLVEAMDEGPLLAYGEYDMPDGITTPQLTDDLIDLSYALLQETVPAYLSGSITPMPQSVTGRAVSYSRKLTKDDSMLDFTRPAEQLEHEVRAFIGWPGSRTVIGGKEVVVTSAHTIEGQGEPGTLWMQSKTFGFYTANGIFVIDKLKPAGKQEMPAEAFLAGYKHLLV